VSPWQWAGLGDAEEYPAASHCVLPSSSPIWWLARAAAAGRLIRQ